MADVFLSNSDAEWLKATSGFNRHVATQRLSATFNEKRTNATSVKANISTIYTVLFSYYILSNNFCNIINVKISKLLQ